MKKRVETGGQDFTLWKVHNTKSMSTALIYCGTPEGFVIGADGRGFDLITEKKYDTERKIFAFENPSASIVFAWSGVVKARVGESVFSLVDRTYELLATLDYRRNIVPQLTAQLNRDLRMLGTSESGECGRGVFLSYRAGRPYGFEISVSKNGRTWECFSDGEGEPNGEIVIMSGPDTDFHKPASLHEAQGLIKDYLDDCVAHPPTDLIGGHVHLGRFTHEGFRWIQPPKQ
jgi:hypothetical protein